MLQEFLGEQAANSGNNFHTCAAIMVRTFHFVGLIMSAIIPHAKVTGKSTCSCKRVAVDGGMDYLRRNFTNNRDDCTELSEYIDDAEDERRNGSDLG